MTAVTDNKDMTESLLDFIRRKGGKVTPRELVTSRKFETSKDALLALKELVASGKGQLTTQECGSKGGRRRTEFVLQSAQPDRASTQHNPAKPVLSTTQHNSAVSTSSDGTADCDDDDEWTGFVDEEMPW